MVASAPALWMEEDLQTDRPRSMAEPAVRHRRRAMLMLPHVAPLTAYAERLRAQDRGEVPDFDPLDGGVGARVLFLLEKPGPMAAGSGFISRNNDDRTAESTFAFMREAGIPRHLTCIWNLVPWWNGSRKVTASELVAGADCFEDLTGLLPALRLIVLVGGKAAKVGPELQRRGFRTLTSWHPSPINRAAAREKWLSIPMEWSKAHSFLT